MYHSFLSDLLKPIMFMEELPFTSICKILSSIWSKHSCHDGIFVVCRQSIFLLAAQIQHLNNIMKSWKSYQTFVFWYSSLYYLNKLCIHLPSRSYTSIFLNFWQAMVTMRKQPAFNWNFSCICCINYITLIVSMQNI